ncbi:hypothetical protein V8C40DRAFT_242505 [Trichoderma camerunense]
MKDYVKEKGPDLLTRIEFRPWDLETIAKKADVYLFPTLTYRRDYNATFDLVNFLFLHVMAFRSRIISNHCCPIWGARHWLRRE